MKIGKQTDAPIFQVITREEFTALVERNNIISEQLARLIELHAATNAEIRRWREAVRGATRQSHLHTENDEVAQ